MQNIPFVLASSSPRRRELIGSLGITYRVIKPDIDESQHTHEAPLDYVQRLSRQKAEAVRDQLNEEGAILSADTVVILSADTIGIDERGVILGKPTDASDACQMLQALRNREHLVCTAFTILLKMADGEQRYTQVVKTHVTMRDYTDDEIEAYIASGDPFDKAGSYAIQHVEFHPVAKIEGSHTNVVGLPIDEVKSALIALGILEANPTPNE